MSYPTTPEEVRDFMDNLTFDVDGAKTAELPPRPEGEIMVPCSVRLPMSLYEKVKALAEARGVKHTTLMRDWIQEGMTATEQDRLVSMADLLRVVASLPQPPGAAAA